MRNKFTPCLILALALLAGCAQETPSAPETPATSVEETTVPETAPETSETLPEVDEIPIEINPDASPLEPVPAELSCADQTVEGLVEDTVGYTFALPVFSGTDGGDRLSGGHGPPHGGQRLRQLHRRRRPGRRAGGVL